MKLYGFHSVLIVRRSKNELDYNGDALEMWIVWLPIFRLHRKQLPEVRMNERMLLSIVWHNKMPKGTMGRRMRLC
jgi:hypothetical protein